MGKIMRLAVLGLTALVCYTGVAQAQWVFLGKKALGVVNRLTSQAFEKQGQGYDAATVLLEANADKVYTTALDILRRNPNITISHTDNSAREVEFTDDKLLVGLKVTRFEDHLSQLLIIAAGTSGKPGGTSFVVERVFHVCEKMGVSCTLAKD
jgi:hypothetical protein